MIADGGSDAIKDGCFCANANANDGAEGDVGGGAGGNFTQMNDLFPFAPVILVLGNDKTIDGEAVFTFKTCQKIEGGVCYNSNLRCFWGSRLSRMTSPQ